MTREPRLHWKVRLGGNERGGAHPEITDGVIYAWDDDGRLLLVDASTGTVQQRVLPRLAIGGLYGLEGRILYLGTVAPYREKLRVFAYHLDRGEILWSREMFADHGIIWKGRIHVVTWEDVIETLDAADGSTLWRHQLRPGSLRSPLAAAGRNVYVCSEGKAGFDAKGYVLALDAETGDVDWVFATSGVVKQVPVLTDHCVYVSALSAPPRQLYCLAAKPASRLGAIHWQQELAFSIERGILARGILYAGTFDGPVCAIDAETGHFLWSFHVEDTTAAESPPCLLGSWIFAGSQDGYLYGLDRKTGALRWKRFLGEETQEIKAPESAEPVANESSGQSHFQDPVLWADGERLYVAREHGFLSCFQIPREEAD